MTEQTPVLEPGGDIRALALERIKKRRDLGAHAFVFVIMNSGFWAVWAVTGAGYAWPAWITGLWAAGLATNAWDALVRRPITEDDVRREIDRLRPAH